MLYKSEKYYEKKLNLFTISTNLYQYNYHNICNIYLNKI